MQLQRWGQICVSNNHYGHGSAKSSQACSLIHPQNRHGHMLERSPERKNGIMSCLFFPSGAGSMGINQYVCSVDDGKTLAPVQQGETQPECAALCWGSCMPLSCPALEPCTRKSRGVIPWSSLVYQEICSWKEELRWAVPDFSPGWASCTTLQSSTTPSQSSQLWHYPGWLSFRSQAELCSLQTVLLICAGWF